MKMNTNRAWLLNKAAQEDGCYVSAGGLADFLDREEQTPGNFSPMRHAFARFVQLARRERRLSIEQFAAKSDVELIELLKIETEENHEPAVETVRRIAGFLEVPEKKLMALAGLHISEDAQLQTEALKFAARSASVEKLTRKEHADLEGMVKVLCL